MSDGSPASRFGQYLTERVHGSYLFAKLVLDLIERGHLVIKSTRWVFLMLNSGTFNFDNRPEGRGGGGTMVT